MTNKKKILNYLCGRSWVLGAELQRGITEKVSPATIDRLARKMAEDGELIKSYTRDGYVQYQLSKEQPRLI